MIFWFTAKASEKFERVVKCIARHVDLYMHESMQGQKRTGGYVGCWFEWVWVRFVPGLLLEIYKVICLTLQQLTCQLKCQAMLLRSSINHIHAHKHKHKHTHVRMPQRNKRLLSKVEISYIATGTLLVSFSVKKL